MHVQSEINPNKSELLSHFPSSFVCFAYTNGNYWVGIKPPAPPPRASDGLESDFGSLPLAVVNE